MDLKLVSQPKTIGIILILLALLLSASLWSLTTRLKEELHKNCPVKGEFCPFKTSYPFESYVGFTGIFILLLMSGYFLTSTSKIEKTSKKTVKQIKSLKGDEKQIYNMIADSDGSMFQNDLVQKTGFSKVKVSRILDRLEMKGIVERRRRGMSNIVVIK